MQLDCINLMAATGAAGRCVDVIAFSFRGAAAADKPIGAGFDRSLLFEGYRRHLFYGD